MNVDCIILTNSDNADKIRLTKRTILTLKDSEPNINFDVYLVDSANSSHPQHYNTITTKYIQPKENFNYNRFLNIASSYLKNDWVIISNNDVGYEYGWLSEIFKIHQERPDIESFSPKDPLLYMKYYDWHFVGSEAKYYECYKVTEAVNGWCIVIKKCALDKILPFDEIFDMYYQDNDYAETLKSKGIKHALVRNSIACHLNTLNVRMMNDDQKRKFKIDEIKFRTKWNQ
jgi:GT2 family glycosyltransferase